jgi:threonylcarbamoyladenosine tRNA methylthiotransferase MtaB
VNFLKDLDISYLHVFTYSERANTGAPKLGEKVPMELRRERSKKLHLLSDRKKRQFYLENEGTERQVLFEQEEEEGTMFGFSENYVKVKFPYDSKLANTFQNVRLLETDRDGIMKVELIEINEIV